MRELSLREGDVVKIYSRMGGDQGWWRGETNGRVSGRARPPCSVGRDRPGCAWWHRAPAADLGFPGRVRSTDPAHTPGPVLATARGRVLPTAFCTYPRQGGPRTESEARAALLGAAAAFQGPADALGTWEAHTPTLPHPHCILHHFAAPRARAGPAGPDPFPPRPPSTVPQRHVSPLWKCLSVLRAAVPACSTAGCGGPASAGSRHSPFRPGDGNRRPSAQRCVPRRPQALAISHPPALQKHKARVLGGWLRPLALEMAPGCPQCSTWARSHLGLLTPGPTHTWARSHLSPLTSGTVHTWARSIWGCSHLAHSHLGPLTPGPSHTWACSHLGRSHLARSHLDHSHLGPGLGHGANSFPGEFRAELSFRAFQIQLLCPSS